MTQYEDDYDIDYTAPSSPQAGAQAGGGQKPSDQDMNLDPYDDLLDVDTLDDASWDEPMPAAQPRKTMKSGKSVKGGKKSSLFTPLLIGGAVLAGLGIIYFQFSGSSAPTTPSAMPQPMPTAEMPIDPNNPNMIPNADPNAMPQPAPTDPAAMAGQQPVPATGDLLALQQAQNDPNAMPQPAPTDAGQPNTPPTGGLLNDPNLLPPANAPAPADTAAPADPSAPVTTTDPAAMTNVETPPAPAPAIIPEPTPAPSPTPAPVVKTPQETTPVVTATQPTPAPTPAPDTTTISNKELEEMRATIARLESKVKELESKPAETVSTASTSSSSNLADEVAPAPKKKTTTKKATSSTKKKPADAGYIAKAKTPAKSSSWELRGIAGGEAIVSKRGSEDFQSVGVGDNLSGVGTITSITNQNGAWVIEGTSGKIRQ